MSNLTLISRDQVRRRYGLYRCVCGAEKLVRVDHVNAGKTTSCGCKHAESIAKAKTRHGHSCRSGMSPEYRVWLGMLNRCCNPNDLSYKRYGAVGITVCDEWANSFEQFFAEMGNRPKNTSIDRIDNTKGYYSANCRWATPTEQVRNRSITIKVGGIPLAELAETHNLAYGTLRKRLVSGLELDEALTLPLQRSYKQRWAKLNNLPIEATKE